MKRFIVTILSLTILVGSVFATERKIKVSQKAEEGKIPQTIVSNYDADSLATKKFDKETMTNYFITIYTNKNGTVVQCKVVGKDADFFLVTVKDIPENVLAAMFVLDFDKTWEMMKNEKIN